MTLKEGAFSFKEKNATLISTERKTEDDQVQYKHISVLKHKAQKTNENNVKVHCLAGFPPC